MPSCRGRTTPWPRASASANLNPFSVFVSGRYAYVASYNNDSLAIFDVSDPNNLVAKGSTSANLGWPASVYVAGRYAYVARHGLKTAWSSLTSPTRTT